MPLVTYVVRSEDMESGAQTLRVFPGQLLRVGSARLAALEAMNRAKAKLRSGAIKTVPRFSVAVLDVRAD